MLPGIEKEAGEPSSFLVPCHSCDLPDQQLNLSRPNSLSPRLEIKRITFNPSKPGIFKLFQAFCLTGTMPFSLLCLLEEALW